MDGRQSQRSRNPSSRQLRRPGCLRLRCRLRLQRDQRLWIHTHLNQRSHIDLAYPPNPHLREHPSHNIHCIHNLRFHIPVPPRRIRLRFRNRLWRHLSLRLQLHTPATHNPRLILLRHLIWLHGSHKPLRRHGRSVRNLHPRRHRHCYHQLAEYKLNGYVGNKWCTMRV